MRSRLTAAFRHCYRQLPAEARRDARKAYRLWREDPQHPSLQFKEIEITKNKSFWSVRTELGYRALGMKPERDVIVWHWVGPHAEYDRLIDARRAKKKPSPG